MSAKGAESQGYDIAVDGGLKMHGTLCQPSNSNHSDTVMVLVPGATYNSSYWDFPFYPETYSFRAAMNRAGFATMVVDRLGTGYSSRPASALVTIPAQVNAVHAVIDALREGIVGGRSYSKVILAGHSLGSIIAMVASGTYNDADATLLTGYTHVVNTEFTEKLMATSLYPAAEDPKFKRAELDSGYLTTRPGSRGAAFHGSQTSDPRVIAVDEETKDLVSSGEAADAIDLAAGSSTSLAIQHPVMIATGSDDPIFKACNSSAALKDQEQNFFGPRAQLQTMVIRDTGHDVALAKNTGKLQREVIDWANNTVQ